MKIAIGADHAGFEFKNVLSGWLTSLGHIIHDFGTNSPESVDYPDFALPVSRSVVSKENELGIIFCGTGIGVSITANKVPGVRAANCCSTEMAALARQHNDANILTLGARLINIELAKEIILVFLQTEFQGGRHQKRIDKIHDLTGC